MNERFNKNVEVQQLNPPFLLKPVSKHKWIHKYSVSTKAFYAYDHSLLEEILFVDIL